jgi:hypothetical protein
VNREHIIEMAKESGLVSKTYEYDGTDEAEWVEIERFAALAFAAGAAAEREECAKVCEAIGGTSWPDTIAAAIRARGETK